MSWTGAALALVIVPAPPDGIGRLRDLIGIPYLEDGVQDELGRWSTFSNPGEFQRNPGLNCSGFLVTAARRILGFHGSSAMAARDRQGDSGPTSRWGHDWDFGWDLILNLSEGRPRRWIWTNGEMEVADGDAVNHVGFKVHDAAAWEGVRSGMRADRVYLAAFLRPRPGAAPPRYHHVALLLKDPGGTVWLYQTLPKGRVHRLGISGPAGYKRLCRMFGPSERIRILEVDPSSAP